LGRANLPVMALAAILLLNLCWSVSVEDGQVRTSFLFDLLPKSATLLIFFLFACAALASTRRTIIPRLRTILNANIALIAGALLGAGPAVLYVLQHLYQGQSMEPTLPLGFRPLWLTGETLVYMLKGLPLHFGADPRPFVDHVTVGRDRGVVPLDIFYAAVAEHANHLALAAGIILTVAILWAHRRELARLLALKTERYSPNMLLILGISTTVGLFLLGGCSCSFTTIRYLLPLWAFLPGLIASVVVNHAFRIAGRIASISICIAWGLGQICLHEEIGGPHPLKQVARTLEFTGLKTAKAEILDAQLLSYLTGQRCKVAEFEPFWPRLAHYNEARLESYLQRSASVYIVNTHDWDRTADWTDLDSPGPPPPETQRTLWPALKKELAAQPQLLIDRRPLAPGYEVFTLTRPLNESTAGG
jgi:hypothetical protein